MQLFDSWAGNLSANQYIAGAAPFSSLVLWGMADLGIPRIHFGLGTSELLVAMRDAGADVVGIDHRISLHEASRRLGSDIPVQGNIDPAALFAGTEALERHTRQVLASGAAAPSHVVNLGHGVPPGTDAGVLTGLVDFVHDNPDLLGS